MGAAPWKMAVRGIAQGALVGLAGGAAAAMVFRSPEEVRGITLGVGVSWLASSLSAAALMLAKASSLQAFWWAFGWGLAFRLLVLVGLMALSFYTPEVPQATLLVTYALGVLVFLVLECRQIKIQ
jgi:uncharacterized membrane protein YeiB